MDEHFENLFFKAFQTDNILLNNNADPDENLYNDISLNSEYVTPAKAAIELKQVDQNNFSILHLNIRSLNKNFEDFKSFFLSLNFNYGVICLSETWCEDNIINFNTFQIQNYTLIHQERSYKNNGG